MTRSSADFRPRTAAKRWLGLLWVALSLAASACGGVELGDILSRDMPPTQAKACRDAVAAEMARQGVNPERVKRIYYERMQNRQRGGDFRNTGYRAWVYPKLGREAMVIEITNSCQVRDVYMQGPEGGDPEGHGGTM